MSRIAIVTGASSGLGREFVKLIDGGAAGSIHGTWAIARRADRLDALVRTCKPPRGPSASTSPTPFRTTWSRPRSPRRPGMQVALLINNAGAGTFGPFAKLSRDEGC